MSMTIAEINDRRRPRTLLGALVAVTVAALCLTGKANASVARQDDVSTCPVDASVCVFASQINRSLLGGDTDPIIALMEPRAFICPGPEPRDVGDPFPICDGSAPDDLRDGYIVGFLHSHGAAYSTEQLRAFFARWIRSSLDEESDGYGSGAARLMSIGCPGIQTDEGASCRDRFTIVFSALQQLPDARMPLRIQLVFHVDRTDGTQRIVHVQSGLVLPPDLHTVLHGGRIDAAVSPVLGAPSGTFFAWPG